MHDYKLELVSESRARARAKAREATLRDSNKAKEAAEAKELLDARNEALEAEALAILRAREVSKAAEDARINAAATDEWFYIQDEEQIGPVGLSQLIDILWNPLTEPPLKLVWTEGMDEWKPFYDIQKLSDSKPSGMSQTAQDNGSPHQLEATVAELRAAAEADLRAAAEAEAAEERANAREEKSKAENQTKLREAAEAKALEEARNASLAKANARKETELRMAAEAKADEQIKLRAAAEAKAEELEKRAAAAEAKARLEARAAIEEKSRAEEAARAKASEEAKLREEAEVKAAGETKLRIAAEARAGELEKLATAAGAQAKLEAHAALEEKSRTEEAARAKASEEVKLRKAAEAKAAEESKLRIAAEAKAEEQAKLRAIAEAKAAEEAEARSVAEAKARQGSETVADENAKAAEEPMPNAVSASPAAVHKRTDAENRAAIAERKKTKAANKARIKAGRRASFQAAAKARAEAEQANEETNADVSRERRIAKDVRLKKESLEDSANDQPAKPEIEIPEQQPGGTDHANKLTRGGILSRNVWYYTCEGERRGPVSFDQLRKMGSHSQLDPRLDMVWKLGTDLWKPAGEVDGLFERKDVPAKTKDAFEARKVFSTSNRRKSRDPETGNRIWPGARRRSLLLVTLVFPFAWQYALGAAGPFLMRTFGETLMGHVLPAATLLPLLVFVHFGLKRLMNLGMSRWWLLALSVPVLNIWVGFRCFVCPDGYVYHKKLDQTAKVSAILYCLAILACLIHPAATIAPLLNALASPAIWKSLF